MKTNPHNSHVRAVFASVACLVAATNASAQSFNIDLHGPTPALVPSPAYGAAALQSGVWNGIPCTGPCFGLSVPLVDLTGAATSVTANVDLGSVHFCPDPSTSGDDEALLDHGALLEVTSFLLAGIRFEHLQPGTYDVYGYASAACPAPAGTVEFSTTVLGFGHTWRQNRWFPASGWNGAFQEDVNYTRTRCRVEAGDSLQVFMLGSTGAGRFAQGVQLVRLSGDVQPLCFGTNEATAACPCGMGAFGSGCPSSIAPEGAALDGTGQALVAADTLRLTATHLPDASVLVFQGTQFGSVSAESVPFGDGLRCAGGTTVRIATRTASMGTLTYPGPNDPPISQSGGVPASGGFRLYQFWYRNAAPFCTSATFNLTNAVAVDWR